MKESLDKILYISILIYVLIMTTIMIVKPSIMYDRENNQFKSFGTKENQTIFPIYTTGILLCFIIYFIVIVYYVFLKLIESE